MEGRADVFAVLRGLAGQILPPLGKSSVGGNWT